jgi:hypothetical protein
MSNFWNKLKTCFKKPSPKKIKLKKPLAEPKAEIKPKEIDYKKSWELANKLEKEIKQRKRKKGGKND